MILRRFFIADGDEVPAPGVVAHERQRAPFAEAADGEQWRAAAFGATGDQRLAARGAHLVQCR